MKTIKIKDPEYKRIKLYCCNNNFKISAWAQAILIANIDLKLKTTTK